MNSMTAFTLLVKSISEAQRKRDPHAGPGDSFPEDPEHIRAAWDLAGHAANPAAVRAKVLAYARAHGLMDRLPETARHHGSDRLMQKATGNQVEQLLELAFNHENLEGDTYEKQRLIRWAQQHGIAQHLPDEAHGFMHLHNMPHMHDDGEAANGFHTHEVTKAFNPVAKTYLIEKALPQEDGSLVFEGWLSTPAKDTEKDVAEPEAFVGSLDSYFERRAPISNTHNKSEFPVGHAQKAVAVRDGQVLKASSHPTDPAEFEHWDGTGTGVYVRGRITDEKAADQIRKGNLGGLSYIANLKKYEPLPGGGRRFLELNPLIESTVAAYPINHEAVITVAKSFGLTDTNKESDVPQNTVPSLEQILADLGESLKEKEAAPAVTKADLEGFLTAFGDKITAAFDASVQKAATFQRGEGTGRVGGEGAKADPRESDPAGYIVQKAREVEDAGRELEPMDKDLAYRFFYASMFPLTKQAGGADDEE